LGIDLELINTSISKRYAISKRPAISKRYAIRLVHQLLRRLLNRSRLFEIEKVRR